MLQFIRVTKEAGDKVILMIDGNEIMLQGKLARELRKDEFGMKDHIWNRIGNKKFPTWFRGQEQIDAIWTSDDIEVSNISFLSFSFSIGDHRRIIMDIPEESILGNRVMRIQRPYTRRLITKRPGVKEKCLKELEFHLNRLKLKEHVENIK